MDLLDRLTRAIGEHQDLHGILQVVVRSLEDHLPLDFCCVCLYDAVDRTLSVACVGPAGEALARELGLGEEATIRIDANGLSRCLRGQLVYEPDISTAPTPFAQQLAAGGLRSFVGAPLLVESNVFGVLIAARRVADGFTSADCEFLRQLSEHVGARRPPGAAPRRAAARLRRPAPDPAGGDAAGAAAGARADGERHRPRHQQRHLAGGALHRVAARDRAQPEPAGARLPRDHPARHRGRGADGGAHARVLPPARGRDGAAAPST